MKPIESIFLAGVVALAWASATLADASEPPAFVGGTLGIRNVSQFAVGDLDNDGDPDLVLRIS